MGATGKVECEAVGRSRGWGTGGSVSRVGIPAPWRFGPTPVYPGDELLTRNDDGAICAILVCRGIGCLYLRTCTGPAAPQFRRTGSRGGAPIALSHGQTARTDAQRQLCHVRYAVDHLR